MFDTVLEHAVGATGYEVIREVVRGAVREIRDPQKREGNYDVALAVRGAQLDALTSLLDGYAIAKAPSWDRAPDRPAQQFLDDASAFCRRARRQLVDEEWSRSSRRARPTASSR